MVPGGGIEPPTRGFSIVKTNGKFPYKNIWLPPLSQNLCMRMCKENPHFSRFSLLHELG